MKQEKLIIFDWGGVIESHNDNEYSINKSTIDFFKSFGVKWEDNIIIEKFYDCCHNVINHNDANELFNKIKIVFNIECTVEEFVEKYNQYMLKTHFYKEVINYAHSLKSKCKIGVLSNLTPFDKTRINYQVDLSKFDYVWLSFELNCRKPNSKIYDIVENDILITAENILFIDDLEKNLSIPISKGWHTCQAVGTELDKIKKQVEEFLNN